jgi:hypothetical protein
MNLLKEAFIEGYKQRAEGSDLIFDNASRMYAISLFDKYQSEQLTLTDVVKSLPQDNYCNVCNLPTDGEKCYSKRCPV